MRGEAGLDLPTVAALKPIAQRHGLDVVPWGMGWIVRAFAGVQPVGEWDPEPPERAPRGQRNPAADALLLNVYLTGHLWDPQARAIIKPAMDLDTVSDPVRHVQAIKRALGIHRRAGRPRRSHTDAEPADEVYELLKSQVRYMTGHPQPPLGEPTPSSQCTSMGRGG